MKKTKRLFAAVLTAVILISAVPFSGFKNAGFADVFAVKSSAVDARRYKKDIYTYIVKDGKAYIIECDEKATGDIVIPSKLKEYDVYGINAEAFEMRRNITGLTIPDTVIEIGEQAFYGCSSLEKIVLSRNLKILGKQAFENCEKLKDIDVGDNLERIGRNAFSNTAFYNDKSNWDNKVLYLGKYLISAKNQNEKISGKYTIKDGTLLIADEAFAQCYYLKEITFSDDLKFIGNYTFDSCNILATVFFSKSLEKIGNYSFRSCGNLLNIDLPETLNEIGDYAFERCKFTDFTVPKNVTLLGKGVFGKCKNLSNVVFENEKATFGASAFESCTSLQKIKLPKYVEEIPDAMFMYCSNLQLIEIPEGAKTVGIGAFAGCTMLKSAVIPDSVTKISDGAFCDCQLLNFVQIPEKVNYIGVEAFKNCVRIVNKIVIPNGVKEIKQNTFYGCASLPEVIIPEGVITIEKGAFYGCMSFTEVTIPHSVNTIEEYAFYYLRALKTINYYGTKGQWDKIDISNNNELDLSKVNFIISPDAEPSIDIQDSSLTVNYKSSPVELKTTINNAELGDVEWTSSNLNVATVDSNGKVTFHKVGKAVITATVTVTGAKDECEVVVKYSFLQQLIRIFLLGFIWY